MTESGRTGPDLPTFELFLAQQPQQCPRRPRRQNRRGRWHHHRNRRALLHRIVPTAGGRHGVAAPCPSPDRAQLTCHLGSAGVSGSRTDMISEYARRSISGRAAKAPSPRPASKQYSAPAALSRSGPARSRRRSSSWSAASRGADSSSRWAMISGSSHRAGSPSRRTNSSTLAGHHGVDHQRWQRAPPVHASIHNTGSSPCSAASTVHHRAHSRTCAAKTPKCAGLGASSTSLRPSGSRRCGSAITRPAASNRLVAATLPSPTVFVTRDTPGKRVWIRSRTSRVVATEARIISPWLIRRYGQACQSSSGLFRHARLVAPTEARPTTVFSSSGSTPSPATRQRSTSTIIASPSPPDSFDLRNNRSRSRPTPLDVRRFESCRGT